MELIMELTLNQALQQAIQAQKAGQVQEADRVYTAILKAQPKHPDANHNMGILAVGVGKVQEAIPFFKTALEANPNTAHFWLSYIDALIKLERLADARAMFNQARGNGAKGDGFDALKQRLNLPTETPTGTALDSNKVAQNKLNILDTLKLDQAIRLAKKNVKENCLEEARRVYQDILVKFPKNKRAIDGIKALSGGPDGKETKVQDPPQDELKPIINLYGQGQFLQALDQISQLMQQFPNSVSLHNILGSVNKGLGKSYAAIEAYNKALALEPDNAGPYYNKGNALKEQGKIEEAIVAYRKAITLKPDYAVAHSNLGIALQDQGKLEDAIASYNKALVIKPDYADAYYNLGNALREQGDLKGVIESYNKALAIKPDYAQVKHMLSSLAGETTNSAPAKYVEALFDNYASKFETVLVGELGYNIPKVLSNIIVSEHSYGLLGSVLDLGCGTGLTGVEIKGFCSNLEGIDLSNRMLEQARVKNVYDKLSHFDIIGYLSNEELNFDYFISTDVFVYVGNLSEMFRLIKSRNKRHGKLTFSTEHTEKDGFHLQRTGRYSHSKSYIEGLCEQFNYTISHFSQTNLRKEKGEFLTGGIYILSF